MASITIRAPRGLNIPWSHIIDEGLHKRVNPLEILLKDRVQDRTPVLTGALQQDVLTEGNPSLDNPLLVKVYSGTQEQLDMWNRVYVLYQEGGVLGLPTYTNDPHEMYARILTDDIPIIAEWAALSIAQELVEEFSV